MVVIDDPKLFSLPTYKTRANKLHPKVEFGDLQVFHTFVLILRLRLG